MTDVTVQPGQVATDSTGITAAAPGSDQTSGSSQQTTGTGSATRAEESFFDLATIQDKPELVAAYKQMQGSYTKAMQRLSDNRSKLEQYEAFERDPISTLQRVATQYGYNFVQRAKDSEEQQQEFKSWDDVMSEAERRVMAKMNPQLRTLQKQTIEMQLDRDFPDWRTYETDMMAKLREHPTLVHDPATLYRMSVPAEVIEARATKAAMAKLRASTDSSQVAGGTTVRTSQAPSGPLTFSQAVERARALVAQQGLKRPA